MTATPDLTPKPASAHTCDANRRCCAALDFTDRRDFDDARRGFIATLPAVEIKDERGGLVWTLKGYEFLDEVQAPDSVNPSLWRQARLNLNHGLFQVTDRIYQIRGFDISNMTVIEGSRGVIVIDPLISAECAAAALALYRAQRGNKPVTAVIYTHSHTDHYGGVRGVVDEADVRAGHVPVYAPDQFLEQVTAEAVLAGSPMLRRAAFQFGPMLARGPRGQVDAGLGKTTSRGTITLIPPTHVIKQPVEVHTIDGVEIVFQLTPDSEAPAEMHMFYPGLRALNLAENATHNLHNIYPIRGAQVRDANAWSKYLGEALVRYAPKSDVVIAQHHWPIWGGAAVQDFLTKQRDAYKFMHDQTLRFMNRGLKPAEIAERMAWPKALEGNWATRPYYGTLSHNSKAIYQRYLGWYDGNPAALNPLPPVEKNRKLVDYMGGAAAALAKARADFARGEYRWVAEITSSIVFAEPNNTDARSLCADAMEQLAYQSESATWRNAYLQGAMELRHGLPKFGARAPVRMDIVRALPTEQVFDYLGIRLDAAKADGLRFSINWSLTDVGEHWVLTLDHCALTAVRNHTAPDAALSLTLSRPVLIDLIFGVVALDAALADGRMTAVGDASVLPRLLGMLETPGLGFPVVDPHPEALVPTTPHS
jgi:alkyl sulfatase BDS1-like metallo-beta-lactamase superfamily hydrolase